MIKGDIYLTYDPNVLVEMAIKTNTYVLFLQEREDIDHKLMMSINTNEGNIASCLLPDYRSSISLPEQGREAFERNYFEYLSSKSPMIIMISILRSLCNGNNILLYTSYEHSETFVPELLKFFGLNFGLIIGLIGTPQDRHCGFDLSYTKKLIETLYLFDMYSVNELFIDFPEGEWFSDNVVSKLVLEMQPYMKNPNPTLKEYSIYFYNYKERVKGRKRFLKSFIHRG